MTAASGGSSRGCSVRESELAIYLQFMIDNSTVGWLSLLLTLNYYSMLIIVIVIVILIIVIVIVIIMIVSI